MNLPHGAVFDNTALHRLRSKGLTLIRMTKDEKGLAFFKGFLL
jgi:hypothetical protein